MGYEWGGIKAKQSFSSRWHDSFVCLLSSHNRIKNRKRNIVLAVYHSACMELAECYIKPLKISNKKMKGVLVAVCPVPNRPFLHPLY